MLDEKRQREASGVHSTASIIAPSCVPVNGENQGIAKSSPIMAPCFVLNHEKSKKPLQAGKRQPAMKSKLYLTEKMSQRYEEIS